MGHGLCTSALNNITVHDYSRPLIQYRTWPKVLLSVNAISTPHDTLSVLELHRNYTVLWFLRRAYAWGRGLLPLPKNPTADLRPSGLATSPPIFCWHPSFVFLKDFTDTYV